MNLSVQKHFVVFAYSLGITGLQWVSLYIRIVPNAEYSVLAVVDYGGDLVTFTHQQDPQYVEQ